MRVKNRIAIAVIAAATLAMGIPSVASAAPTTAGKAVQHRWHLTVGPSGVGTDTRPPVVVAGVPSVRWSAPNCTSVTNTNATSARWGGLTLTLSGIVQDGNVVYVTSASAAQHNSPTSGPLLNDVEFRLHGIDWAGNDWQSESKIDYANGHDHYATWKRSSPLQFSVHSRVYLVAGEHGRGWEITSCVQLP